MAAKSKTRLHLSLSHLYDNLFITPTPGWQQGAHREHDEGVGKLTLPPRHDDHQRAKRALWCRWLHAKLKTLACRCPNLDSEGALQREVIQGFASHDIESMRWQCTPSKLTGGLAQISQRQPSMKLVLEWGEGVLDYTDSFANVVGFLLFLLRSAYYRDGIVILYM
jgi:hypothetical protein